MENRARQKRALLLWICASSYLSLTRELHIKFYSYVSIFD